MSILDDICEKKKKVNAVSDDLCNQPPATHFLSIVKAFSD